MQTLWQDVRFALRLLRKSPGFTFVAVLTLAVAIGANALVFGVFNALLLRPLNVPHPQNLYAIQRDSALALGGYESYPDYLDLRERNRSFADLAVHNTVPAGLDTGNNPSMVMIYEVSGNYFDILGIQPYLGRLIQPSDERGPNSAPFIVLSYQYWQNHFQADRNVIGRSVLLNKHPVTVIGVTPPGFIGTSPLLAIHAFVPIVNHQQLDGADLLNARGVHWIDAFMGRLKPGVTREQAIAETNAIAGDLAKTYPKEDGDAKFTVTREGFGDDSFGNAIRAFLLGLLLLSGLILLAACTNLGSLFAARAADRSKEVALRMALGAGRRRVLRQLFTEAALISLIGGAAGLWASVALLRWLSVWQPFAEYPLNLPVSPDARIYGIALLLSVASALLFSVVPVKQVLRIDPYQVIKSGSTGAAGRRLTARDLLLGVQVAICAVLVTASFVAVRGLQRALNSNFGFEPSHTMLVNSDPHMAGYTDADIPQMQKRLIQAMQQIPGVTSVGFVGQDPPVHLGWEYQDIYTDATTDLRPANVAASAVWFRISPEYFQAAGTTLLAGRAFTWHDDKGAPRVGIVNREFARKIFGSADKAIGAYYKMGDDGARIQVVGIVEDGKYTANITEVPQPAVFVPILQSPSSEAWLVLRSNRDPQQLAPAIRSAMHELDSSLPFFMQTWHDEMNGALFASRMAMASLGVLGAMGAMLAVTGIFGMAAYSVSKRLRELGIRMALGAQRKEVLQAALGRAFKLLAFGSLAGLLLGILASRVLAAIVYQATPRDPLVLAGVILSMMLLGLVAAWIPARRALSIEPLVLLREE
jgi:predicted permease